MCCCKIEKYKKIEKRKIAKKEKKRVAHKQKRQCSVHLCDCFAKPVSLLHLDTCTSFLVPWSNYSITFSRPATRTSTWNSYSALLSVTELCDIYIYIYIYIYMVSLSRAPTLSSRTGTLLQSHPRSLDSHTGHRLPPAVLVRTL
jgi:prepilin signal peptidase PulO-like enzyme (type II secretory pathway)